MDVAVAAVTVPVVVVVVVAVRVLHPAIVLAMMAAAP